MKKRCAIIALSLLVSISFIFIGCAGMTPAQKGAVGGGAVGAIGGQLIGGDVPTLLREEEYVSCMVPRRSSAATKDATTKRRMEEFAKGMVHN